MMEYSELASRRAKRGYGRLKSELLEEFRVTSGAFNLAYIFDPDNLIPKYKAKLKSIESELIAITQ